jgi:large subunit ribosomal protein L2
MGKRIIAQRRGRLGGPYQSPSHRHKGGKNGVKYLPIKHAAGKITKILHDSGRTAPLANVELQDGQRAGEHCKFLAPEGLFVNQEIDIGDRADIAVGNILPLRAIPEGTPIFNIESQPGDGGKFVRAGGTVASIVSHGTKTIVQLPSGQFKPFHPECRATIGVVAGGGRKEKPFMRAGKKFHAIKSRAKKYPSVSGVAMNPVDHPHGGGAHQHVGKASTVSKHAPPGRKVGRLSPKKKKKK